MKSEKIRILVLVIAIVVAYADTLTLHYASDDRMIIFENDYTLKGFQGIPEVMTKDAFSGFFGEERNLVAGGRYRPLSQITFILEYELFGGSIRSQAGFHQDPKNEQLFSDSIMPIVQHGGNLILFILLCLSIYAVLKRLFPKLENEKWYFSVPFIATLLFALHPLHTEAVANIKGRDEIMCMLGSVLALYASIRFVSDHKWWWLLVSFAAMMFGIFSKENAITFLAIVPLALYFMDDPKNWKDYLLTLLPLAAASAIFLAARTHALGGLMNQSSSDLILNNPFLYATTAQTIATVILTWGIYLKLMFFPHPLTHDYYPHHIEITNFANPAVLLVTILIIGLIIFAIKTLKQKNTVSFGILFFIITFSITSNLLFNVGTFMNERFLFTSLLGFTLIIAYLIQKLQKVNVSGKVMTIAIVGLCLLYGGKTAARNLTWHDDITLFTTDVKTSKNSIKCNVSAGGSYLKLYDKTKKKKYLKLAEEYLFHAFKLGCNTSEAYSLLGKFYFLKEDYDRARQCYEIILQTNPTDKLASNNLKLAINMQKQNEAIRVSKLMDENKVDEALQLANQLVAQNPNSAQLYNLLGRIYGEKRGDIGNAITCLKKAIEIDPTFMSAYENLGIAYATTGDFQKAMEYLTKALEIEPDNRHVMNNIAMLYENMGEKQKAEEFRKAHGL